MAAVLWRSENTHIAAAASGRQRETTFACACPFRVGEKHAGPESSRVAGSRACLRGFGSIVPEHCSLRAMGVFESI
eukprot:4382304-Lingulodinium_polyedra.AAC.1